MSKITNDGLTWSGTGCFIDSCMHMATVGVKGLNTVGSFLSETEIRLVSGSLSKIAVAWWTYYKIWHEAPLQPV